MSEVENTILCGIALIHPAERTSWCALVAVVFWTHHENANTIVGHMWKRTSLYFCKNWVVISNVFLKAI
jgi:hypothetical protein